MTPKCVNHSLPYTTIFLEALEGSMKGSLWLVLKRFWTTSTILTLLIREQIHKHSRFGWECSCLSVKRDQ